MEMKEVVFRVVGLSPLLQHSPNGMKRPTGGIGRKEIPSPEAEAEAGTYRLPNGQLGHPAEAFRSAMLVACVGRRVGGGKQSAKSVMQGAVFNVPEQILVALEDPETGKPLEKYEIDVRRVVVQNSAVLRARPRLDRWAGFLRLHVDPEIIGTEEKMAVLTELLNVAGRVVGVGELRPRPPKGNGGPFGRFRVELVE